MDKLWILTVLFPKPDMLSPMPIIKEVVPFDLTPGGAMKWAEIHIDEKYPNCQAWYLSR